jgi:hypothetical protein
LNNGALALACFYGHQDALQFLVDVSHLSVNERHEVETLVYFIFPIALTSFFTNNSLLEIGRTALHWAAFHGETSVCTFLLDRDAKINSQDEVAYICQYRHP